MSEPVTAAGRALLLRVAGPDVAVHRYGEAIAAIEAEAAAAALAGCEVHPILRDEIRASEAAAAAAARSALLDELEVAIEEHLDALVADVLGTSGENTTGRVPRRCRVHRAAVLHEITRRRRDPRG